MLASELMLETTSRSKTFGIHHVQVGTADANDLVNLKTGKAVVRLKGFSAFDGENYGGVYVAYNKPETIVAVTHAGKWEPRALSLVSTATGVQTSILKKVQKDSKDYYFARAKAKKQSGIVFQVGGGEFEGGSVSFWIIGEVPKNENIPPVYQSVTYSCKLTKTGFTLGKPRCKSLTVKDNFGWEKNVD